ncbi:hypothetical protein HK405_004671 [Cladochytrium tenue]|nr:hypothetical protein HK405_004671 [Cladochytrium tenue]
MPNNNRTHRSSYQASQQAGIKVLAPSVDASTSPGGARPSVGTIPTGAGAAPAPEVHRDSQWQSMYVAHTLDCMDVAHAHELVYSSDQEDAVHGIPSNDDANQVRPGFGIDCDGLREALTPPVPGKVSGPLFEHLDPGFVQSHEDQTMPVRQQPAGVAPSEDCQSPVSDGPLSPSFFDEYFQASVQEGQSSESTEGFEQSSGAVRPHVNPTLLASALEPDDHADAMLPAHQLPYVDPSVIHDRPPSVDMLSPTFFSGSSHVNPTMLVGRQQEGVTPSEYEQPSGGTQGGPSVLAITLEVITTETVINEVEGSLIESPASPIAHLVNYRETGLVRRTSITSLQLTLFLLS